MRREIVMGGCYLGMAGHDVFNNKVREIVNTNEHRVVLLALDISNFKYINDFYGMDEGDKVMQIKNNYQLEWEQRTDKGFLVDSGSGIFNGDMGIITKINNLTNYIEVKFDDDRYVTYDSKQAEELELAYAVTIHKSQGSEYPAVVMPLVSGASMLMTRNLLYTGVTRAKKCVCIVGRKETFNAMVKNEDQHKRYSGLKWQLINYYQ